MTTRKWRTTSVLASVALVASGVGLMATMSAPDQPQGHDVPRGCGINLALPGMMKDIVSNALMRGLRVPERDVATFLEGAEKKYANGPALLKAAAARFKVGEELLTSEVERFKHCNCNHAQIDGAPVAPLQAHPQALPAAEFKCTADADLALAGKMKDILSNAMMLGLRVPGESVTAFLNGAEEKYPDGPALLKAAAAHFKMSEDVLAAEVQRFKHCNCGHESIDGLPRPWEGVDEQSVAVSAFAKDVTLHVVLHELGHALIREFDIPVLGNEETAADAFATYYLTTYLPDRAAEVLTARTTSLMIEAGESPQVDWSGEHDHDGRRAHQIAALAVAADPVKYKAVAEVVGMSESDMKKARDYGAEIHRSWRRVLSPLWMPEGAASAEARVVYDDGNEFLKNLCSSGLAGDVESAVKRFDWHSQVTVRFVDGEGGAGWSRSGRTVTVHSSYVRRFVGQGVRGLPPVSK